MDKEQIAKALSPFFVACKEVGYPITDACLEETYPGDITTPFTLKVKGSWIDEVGYFFSMVELVQLLHKHVPREIRLHIFNIDVYKSEDKFPCDSMLLNSLQESTAL